MWRPSLASACLIAMLTLGLFLASPIHQMGDSKYSILLSHSLFKRGSFTLDGYGLPVPASSYQGEKPAWNEIYQLEVVDGRLYYYFSPGSSILSIPFVAILDLAGIAPVRPDGRYNRVGEIFIQVGIASLLMSVMAAIFYLMSTLVLPNRWSVAVALAGVLGTQVWSTASRGLWSHTWGMFLLGCVALMLVGHETGRRGFYPILVATLLSWAYFVRPTNAITVIVVTLYVLIFHRGVFARYAVTGAGWLAAFIAYSWYHFGQILPKYFRGSPLTFENFWTAVAGNLISPSRGLFVFVPILLFVAYLLARYWTWVPYRPLAALALSSIGAHIILVSGFDPWWAGHSYGPRYLADMVPWFIVLGILAIRAMLDAHRSDEPRGWRIELAVGAVLLVLSVLINGRGAFSHTARMWNVTPVDVDKRPERVWDWSQPQFLAGLAPRRPP